MGESWTIEKLLELSEYGRNHGIKPFECTLCGGGMFRCITRGFVETDPKIFVCYDCLEKEGCGENNE